MGPAAPPKEQWHLDKKVPITLILVAFGHLAGSVWFFRGVVSDVQNTRDRVQLLEQAKTSERIGERLSVVESQVSDIKAVTLRVEANVQKLVERNGARP
jgi:hypothetical protein